MYTKKPCPNCQKDFLPKRLNQLYCGIKCRTFNNNSIAKKRSEETKSLDKRLHKNRLVLKKIYAKCKGIEISTDYLLGADFDFGLYTRIAISNSIRYMLCFEYGIGEVTKDKYIIEHFNKSKL